MVNSSRRGVKMVAIGNLLFIERKIKIMIKRIINHIEYRKKVKLLKMIVINQLTNFVVNKTDYIAGFEKLLLTMAKSDDATELQKLLNDYVDLVKKTKIANDVMNKKTEENS